MSTLVRGRHRMVNGIRLHYLEHGDSGPPLILLPGITSPAASWAFVAERLGEFCRVHTLDNRGRGLSAGGPALGYRLADHAADTAALIRALNLGRVILLGHSMGARIAVATAVAHPDVAGALILVDPPVCGPGRRPYPVPLAWYLDGIANASRGEALAVAGSMLARWTPAQIALREQWLPTCDTTAVAEAWRSFHEEDMHALLPAVRCRTLLLCAGNGDTVRPEEEREIVAALGDGRSVRIANVGHMIPWDDLDAFVAAVKSFVG